LNWSRSESPEIPETRRNSSTLLFMANPDPIGSAALDPHSGNIAALAEAYCRLIESSGAATESWLSEVADLLPRLHAAVLSLDPEEGEDDEPLAADLDARFELFTHLRSLLGDRDGYWLEFDRVDGHSGMTGSLADDLTDIYCELKHALRVHDLHPQLAERGWYLGFATHWGQHLIDAERHLSGLAAQGYLD
jgi:hypothetical protein